MASEINLNLPYTVEDDSDGGIDLNTPPLIESNEFEGDLNDQNVILLDLNRPPEEVQQNETQTNLPPHSVELQPVGVPQTSRQATATHVQQGTDSNDPHHKQVRLNSDRKQHILMWLLGRFKDGKLQHGSIKDASTEFNVSERTISKIWNTATKQRADGVRYNVATKYFNCGRKRVQVPTESLTQVQMGKRTCIRDVATVLNTSKSTVHRLVKRGLLKPHTNSIHPGLTNTNKIARLKWILDLLIGDTPENKQVYHPMYDFVHIDEKWFHLTKKAQRYYLASDERGKYRAAVSKNFIPKIMFATAVARPRFNEDGECTFDGKIGVFPYTYQEPAKRKSKNRDKGVMQTKLIERITKDITREMLITHIVPAIKAKWPNNSGPKVIYIQQDNARTHVTHDDEEWQQVYQQEDFTFILVQQPPNSPDLNVLDLGFFRSIESLMHKKMPENVDKMIEAVNDAFEELKPETLDDVWLSLQYVMNEVLKNKGGNDFDLPHTNKRRVVQQEGRMNVRVKAPNWTVIEAWQHVEEHEQTGGTQQQVPVSPCEDLPESSQAIVDNLWE